MVIWKTLEKAMNEDMGNLSKDMIHSKDSVDEADSVINQV